MSEISITEAAFAGFAAIRQRPATVLIWYLVSVLISALTLTAVADLLGPAMADLQTIQAAGPKGDPTMAIAVMGKVMRGYVVLAPLALIVGAITSAAANRAVLRPDDRGFGYFKLGPDELRLIVVLLVIGLIMVVIGVIGLFVAGVIGVVLAGAAGGAPDPAKMQAGVLLGFIPALLVMLFLGVRLCLAPAQTVAGRAINIFGSWGLTQGRFWPVFLTYLLNAIIYGVVLLAVTLLVGQVGKALGATTNGLVMQPNLTSPSALTQPPMIVYILLTGVTQVASLLLLICPGAGLYRQIVGHDGAEAEMF